MQEAFGGINYVDRPDIGNCKVCEGSIFFDEDMTVDQIKIHKKCFKCGICDYPLQIGYCARDPALEGRYGLYWYCNLEHMLWGPGRKAAELDKLKRGKKNFSSGSLSSPLGSPTSGAPLGSPTGGTPLGSPGATGGGGAGGAATGVGLGSPGSAPSGPVSMLDAIAARKAAGGGVDAAGGPGGAGGIGAGGGAGSAGEVVQGGAGQGGAGGAGNAGAGGGIHGVAGGPGAGAVGGPGTDGSAGTGGAFGTGNEAGFGSKVIPEQVPTVGKCKICDTPIAMCDDITVDRITIHRNCFKCGICDGKLFPGSCARDTTLEPKYGLKWFCGMHMMLGPAKKAEEMDKAGKPKRF